jgi:hypothetical protein
MKTNRAWAGEQDTLSSSTTLYETLPAVRFPPAYLSFKLRFASMELNPSRGAASGSTKQ